MGLRLGDLPLGRQLKVRRVALDLRQRDVAALIGVTTPDVCRAERGGTRGSPTLVGRIDSALRRLEAERRSGGPGAPGPVGVGGAVGVGT